MRISVLLYSWIVIGSCFWTACEKTPEHPVSKGVYEEGVFVINEGLFGNTSGTISHFDRAGKVTPSIFKTANQRDLGDVVQSLVFAEDKGYIVVNNSNKIEVVDAHTFQELAQITDLRLPRYCLPISTTQAYVTEWGLDGRTGSLALIDLTTHTISTRYPLATGPEQLLLKGDYLYITHPGGFSDNNIVTVFDVQQQQIHTTITVADRPSSLVEDANGMIWVACAGIVNYTTYPQIDVANSTASQLVGINPTTQTIDKVYDFGKGKPVGNLIINAPQKDRLFYTREGAVWARSINSAQEQQLMTGSYYGLGYDPQQQQLYTATGTATASPIEVYSPDGQLQQTFSAGQFANGFVFK